VGQKCVIQENDIQDDRRSLDLSLSNEFGVFTSDLGVRESIEIIFRVKKGAGKGEFKMAAKMAAATFRLAYQGS